MMHRNDGAGSSDWLRGERGYNIASGRPDEASPNRCTSILLPELLNEPFACRTVAIFLRRPPTLGLRPEPKETEINVSLVAVTRVGVTPDCKIKTDESNADQEKCLITAVANVRPAGAGGNEEIGFPQVSGAMVRRAPRRVCTDRSKAGDGRIWTTQRRATPISRSLAQLISETSRHSSWTAAQKPILIAVAYRYAGSAARF